MIFFIKAHFSVYIIFVFIFSKVCLAETLIPLKLARGWNLISLPAAPLDANPATIFKDKITDRIWMTSEGKSKMPDQIISGVGYWVFSRKNNFLTINVKESAEEKVVKLQCCQWHLVAAFDKRLTRSAGNTVTVWSWSDGKFTSVNQDAVLEPLNGYFVFSLKDASPLLKFENILPVANAGPDQQVSVSSLMTLNGNASSDANKDALTYSWKFLSKPQGSSADFSDLMAVRPTFFIDIPGTYSVQLVVNDGTADSYPSVMQVTIDEDEQIAIDLKRVKPSTDVLTRIYGSTGDGRAGVPVAGGFDCDGDQLRDTAFSAIKASPLARKGAGEIALVFGNGKIGGEIDTAGFQKEVLKFAGAQPFEVAGAEVWMDDVTGDGLRDMLIGRQNYTPMTGQEGAGALTIIVGSPELRTYAKTRKYFDLVAPPDNINVVTLVGADAYDRLGIWMRTGDITGDNIADIVVGADEVDSENEQNRGAVFVIRGGEHLAASRIVDLRNFGVTAISGHVARINPPPEADRFHFGSTCQIADLDGNGRGEVLMSAALNRSGATIRLPGAPSGTGQGTGGSNRGTLFIAWDDNFPSSLWSSGHEFNISAPTLGTRTIINGAGFNRAFGEEILGGLDYDNDNMADLFIGDLVGDGGNGTQSGVGHIIFKAQNLRDRIIDMQSPPSDIEFSLIRGPTAGALGADSAAQGDFNGDTIPDLLIGNPHDNPHGRANAGTMHIILGQAGSWPEIIDLSPDSLPSPRTLRVSRIEGAFGNMGKDTGDILCYSVSSGDLDGDGYTDIIANEMAGNGLAPSAIDVGNLLIISGAALFDNLSN